MMKLISLNYSQSPKIGVAQFMYKHQETNATVRNLAEKTVIDKIASELDIDRVTKILVGRVDQIREMAEVCQLWRVYFWMESGLVI